MPVDNIVRVKKLQEERGGEKQTSTSMKTKAICLWRTEVSNRSLWYGGRD